MIRVMLVDDHALLREGLRRLLEEQKDIEVVAEAADGYEAIRQVETHRPDIVLMDIGMPGISGLDATAMIRERWPDVQVLLLTVHDDEAYLFRALKVGAAGYVLKEAESSDLVRAIHAVARGEVFLYPSLTRKLVQDYLRRSQWDEMEEGSPLEELTERQRQVLELFASGCSAQEIAEKLVISPYTVQTHLQNIMTRLNLRSRRELIRYAVRHGLVD
ncbi:MAG: DNA-binding response regulator [Caldilineae bacterium]|nr:MAG: DNA-binding response regulator [Caldilineae bacterium]